MRKEKITTGEYYHVYNRGVNKQTIFHDRSDYVRFLFLLIFFQSPKRFSNIIKFVGIYLKIGAFNLKKKKVNDIAKFRFVELVCFCIMPNHFHLLVQQTSDQGTASYMHRVLGGYSRYYNKKYDTQGHLFQNTYKAVHIKNDIQLLYLTAYIHRNPRILSGWLGKEHLYEWSSYQDYIVSNRFGVLLIQEIILDQVVSKINYRHFVESSSAKMVMNK